MMKWGLGILSSASLSNYLLADESKNTKWTHEENKVFENALAVYDKETPDRWHKVAALIPGKTVVDVMRQYKVLEEDVSDIEAGLIPLPGYTASSFTLEWVNDGHGGFDGFKQTYGSGIKRTSSGRPADQERKKGVPWTEDEHRIEYFIDSLSKMNDFVVYGIVELLRLWIPDATLFLLGLKKYGKGDWRNISRNFVITRTPTQVASHAQKYFIRQLSGGKDKRRSSIHDITTVNLPDGALPLPDNERIVSSDQSNTVHRQPNQRGISKAQMDWNQRNDRSALIFGSTNGNTFVSPYGIASYEMKPQGQNLLRGGNGVGANSMVLQMQSMQQHPCE
ncbi:hypothetical protein Syun_016701 [Stephania yunnanensis]|uniref:Uncharacterized protein n=1 Tax=Stephania yunnanensis TaxID=152371 RepID=A0AAP0J5K4_9MAGN